MTTSVSSLLIFVGSSGEDLVLNSVIGKAKVLWSGRDGFEWIGKLNEEWDAVYLLKYRDTAQCNDAVERFRQSAFERIKVLGVRPVSSLKIRLIRFLMKYVYSRSKFQLIDIDLDNIPQSDILPTIEQQKRLDSDNTEQPVVMVNLMSYNDFPLYPDSFEGKRSKTGKDAYNQYGGHVVRTVASLGGCIQWAGAVEEILIGDSDEEWDEFGLMGYPSRSLSNRCLGCRRITKLVCKEMLVYGPQRSMHFLPPKTVEEEGNFTLSL